VSEVEEDYEEMYQSMKKVLFSFEKLPVEATLSPRPIEPLSPTSWYRYTSFLVHIVTFQVAIYFFLVLNKMKSSCTSIRSLKDLSNRCLGFFTKKALSRSCFLLASHTDFFDSAISKSSPSSFGSVIKTTCCNEFYSSSEDSSS
jgi:hypothetical protein